MTKCANCEAEKTPMWRKTLDIETKAVLTLCNACGICYKTKGCHRPKLLISKKNILSVSELFEKLTDENEQKNVDYDKSAGTTVAGEDRNPKILVKNDIKLEDLNIIRCSNCENINTSIWRRDDNGKSICNACGLFYKKKGYHRAVKKSNEDMFLSIDENLIRFNRIKRRNRSSSSESSTSASTKRRRELRATSDALDSNVIDSSPETSSAQPESHTVLSNNRSPSISNDGPESPDLKNHDYTIGNYRYDLSTFKPPELSPDPLGYRLPRIEASKNFSVKLPPISSILNLNKLQE